MVGPVRRCLWRSAVVILCMTSLAPAGSAQESIPLGPEPVLLRADQPGRLVAGDGGVRVLVHSGVESSTDVAVREVGAEVPETVRSSAQWTLLNVSVSGPGAEVRVTPEGAVWAVAFTGLEVTRDRLAFDCSSLGQYVFWHTEATELRIKRSEGLAPHLQFFTPREGILVPDEPAVLNHTLFLAPTQTPLYFRTVSHNGDDCAGTLLLETATTDGAPVLGETWRELLLMLSALGLALVLVLGGIWWGARQRERYRRGLASLTIVAVLYGVVLCGRQVVMSRPPRAVYWPLLLVALSLLALPSVGAQPFGVQPASEDAPLELSPLQEVYHLCVTQRGPDEEVVLMREHEGGDAAADPVTFRPSEEGADCRQVEAGTYRPQEGALDVLVLSRPPREASAPGVLRMERLGSAVLIPDPTADTDLGLLLDGAGQEVVVVAARDMATIATVSGVGEERVRLAEAATWEDGGVYVVYVTTDDGGAVLVDWKDPSWYRPAPSIGHLATVIVVALLLTLYRGKSPRIYG